VTQVIGFYWDSAQRDLGERNVLLRNSRGTRTDREDGVGARLRKLSS